MKMSANSQFDAVIEKMPKLLWDLRSSRARSRDDLRDIPQHGIYVFYENNVPVYVGRSRQLKQRLQVHSRPSSGHNSATFAFILATQVARKQNFEFGQMTRTQLENDPVFGEFFRQAKVRVGEMKIRVVEVTGPITQTVFEVYAALALGTTTHNDFETH
ncbi:MAG: GIY-YIG nuclease family protein [Chloroflexi bacterium]|nr:GIY-YIG nuclease family protein [Chloroflexota bacterium]